MSAVSYTSLNESATQYTGIAFKSGCRPYFASSAAARSSASGCCRKSSHAFGQLAGIGPDAGGSSQRALQDTERSPRMLSVLNALIPPALAIPTTIPYCWETVGSELVASRRPKSMGGPAYSSNLGRTDPTAVVDAGNDVADPARTIPACAAMVAPSRVTSCVHIPL